MLRVGGKNAGGKKKTTDKDEAAPPKRQKLQVEHENLKKVEFNLVETLKDAKGPAGQLYCCKICKTISSSLIRAVGHSDRCGQVKTGRKRGKSKKRFKCNKCSYVINTVKLLRLHRRRAHPNLLQHRYSCTKCRASLSSTKCLAVHIKHRHTNVRRFACTLCPKSYSTRASRTHHLKSHQVSGEIAATASGPTLLEGFATAPVQEELLSLKQGKEEEKEDEAQGLRDRIVYKRNSGQEGWEGWECDWGDDEDMLTCHDCRDLSLNLSTEDFRASTSFGVLTPDLQAWRYEEEPWGAEREERRWSSDPDSDGPAWRSGQEPWGAEREGRGWSPDPVDQAWRSGEEAWEAVREDRRWGPDPSYLDFTRGQDSWECDGQEVLDQEVLDQESLGPGLSRSNTLGSRSQEEQDSEGTSRWREDLESERRRNSNIDDLTEAFTSYCRYASDFHPEIKPFSGITKSMSRAFSR